MYCYLSIFCHSAILPFYHSVILPFRHSAILPFCHCCWFLLYFDQIHHDQNSKNNSCNLGDMLKSYSTDFDSNLEHECQACKQRTRMVEKNCIVRYPEILCIVLCRSITNGGRILSSVDFPVENFQPSKYLGMNDKNDDTTYALSLQ